MRHHAHDIALDVANPRDIVQRSVGISSVRNPPMSVGITKDDLPLVLQALQSGGIDEIISLAVGDGDFQSLPLFEGTRKRSLEIFHLEMGVIADELKGAIGPKHPWQEMGFSQHLKAVANPQNGPALTGETL